MISIVRELVYGRLVLGSGLRVPLIGGWERHADTGGYSDAIKRQSESVISAELPYCARRRAGGLIRLDFGFTADSRDGIIHILSAAHSVNSAARPELSVILAWFGRQARTPSSSRPISMRHFHGAFPCSNKSRTRTSLS